MKKILILSGLPGSGKSAFAKSLEGFKRLNKDDLRAMVDDSKWSKGNEKTILNLRNTMIKTLMTFGHNIVIDDTNFAPKHIKTIRDLVTLHNSFTTAYMYEVEEKFIDTPLEECIRRDQKRERPVGKRVIMEMWSRYLKPEMVKRDGKLLDMVLIDLDGTLAQCGDRDIYDGSKVHLDTVIEPVAEIVRMYLEKGQVIYLSGRSEEYRGVTEKWLLDNNLWGGKLLMRPEGDKRCDSIVKKELYEQNIKGRYNVKFVMDDRKRIKRMWNQEGIFVLDVNQYDIEF